MWKFSFHWCLIVFTSPKNSKRNLENNTKWAKKKNEKKQMRWVNKLVGQKGHLTFYDGLWSLLCITTIALIPNYPWIGIIHWIYDYWLRSIAIEYYFLSRSFCQLLFTNWYWWFIMRTECTPILRCFSTNNNNNNNKENLIAPIINNICLLLYLSISTFSLSFWIHI